MDPQRFPGGLEGLSSAGLDIGLWISPFGRYGKSKMARIEWAARAGTGFETETRAGDGVLLCPAAPRYHAHLAAAMSTLTAKGVGYWKIDGLQFTCAAPDHGHVAGAAGRIQQLARTRMVLGNPGAGEVYGFVSGRADRGHLCLRNPANLARDIDLCPLELFGRQVEGRRVALELVFGGASLPVSLAHDDRAPVRLPPFAAFLADVAMR